MQRYQQIIDRCRFTVCDPHLVNKRNPPERYTQGAIKLEILTLGVAKPLQLSCALNAREQLFPKGIIHEHFGDKLLTAYRDIR